MIAAASTWSGDLSLGPTGDLETNSLQEEVKQRVIRRLFTNPGDYIWHPGYGAGIGRAVGAFSGKGWRAPQARAEVSLATLRQPA